MFRKLQRRKKFKVVHGFWVLPSGLLAVLLGKLFGLKCVVSVLGGDAVSLPEIAYGQLRNPLYRKLSKITIEHADAVICLTRFLADKLSESGIRGNNVLIIPWGVDVDLFQYKNHVPDGPTKFIHIANLSPVKNQDTLLRAFQIIQESWPSELKILGEGEEFASLRDLVIELGLSGKVEFIPQIDYHLLPAVYRAGDILLHTSLSEGQSEVVTEAMSSGVLVCGTRVGLLSDLPECCVAVQVKDYRALAEAVLRIIKDNVRADKIRKNALEWTAKHTIGWTVQQIAGVYSTD